MKAHLLASHPMRHQGVSIFALFFGLSVLEAIQGRHWVSAALWLSLGVFFVVMDIPSRKHTSSKPPETK